MPDVVRDGELPSRRRGRTYRRAAGFALMADARFNETQGRVVKAAYKAGYFFLHGCSSVTGKQVMGDAGYPTGPDSRKPVTRPSKRVTTLL